MAQANDFLIISLYPLAAVAHRNLAEGQEEEMEKKL